MNISVIKRNGSTATFNIHEIQKAIQKVFGELHCLKEEILTVSNLRDRKQKLVQYRKKEREKGLNKQLLINNIELLSTYLQINTLYTHSDIQKFLKNIFQNNNSTEPDTH